MRELAYDIGPKIGIDGEAEYRRELKNINTSLKTLASEMKVVTSEFAGNEKSVEALTKKNDVLERIVLTLNDKLEIQRKQLLASAAAFGVADERTQRWQQIVNSTQAELNKATAQIRMNEEAIADLSNAEEEATEKGTSLKDILGAAGISGASLTAAGAVAAAAAAVKEFADFIRDSINESREYADNILTLSTNFDIATDSLQAYQYMAELTDTSVDTITGSISRLTRNMDAARNGTGDAADTFRLLGVQVTGNNGELRDAEEVFLQLIDRLGKISNETERDALSMKIFGRSAQDLNSLIAVGADGIAAYTKEAEDMGYILSGDSLRALGEMDDQFQRLDNQMTALKNQIAVEMAPAIIELTQDFLDFAKSADWKEIGRSVASFIRDVTPGLVAIGQTVAGIVYLIAQLAKGIGKVGSFIGGLFKNTGSLSSAISNNTDMYLAGSLPTVAAGGYGNIQIDLTSEIDGEVLARNQYTYNFAESRRRGASAVN